MPVDSSLAGREFPPTAPLTVTADHVAAFAAATGGTTDPEVVPPTYPIVLAFDAMSAFLAAVEVDLFRIVHGDQKFSYVRPIVVGDVLTATLSVTGVRSLGGADIIRTASEIRDAAGELVCTTSATLVHSPEVAA